MERSREQHMEQLRQAILRALQEGELVPPELMRKADARIRTFRRTRNCAT